MDEYINFCPFCGSENVEFIVDSNICKCSECHKKFKVKEDIYMNIRLCQKECDNGKLTCTDCVHHETGDSSIGVNESCIHPILYDEHGNVIPEAESLILDCLNNPKHCILLERKT